MGELARGVSEAEIKKVLLGAGWAEAEVDENILAAKVSTGGGTPSSVQPPSDHLIIMPDEHQKTGFIRRRLKIVLAVIIGTILIAGGAFASYTYLIPSPARVLNQARLNLAEVKSFDYSGKITAEITSQGDLFSFADGWLQNQIQSDKRIAGASNIQFGVDFSGSADFTDEKHPKSDMKVNFNASVLTFGFNLRLIDNLVYFKFDQIPKFAESVAKYSGVWIKVDPESLSKEYGLGINLKNGQPDLTDGQKKQLEDLASQAHFFDGVTKLTEDSIDGVSMYHYGLTIDKAGLKSYLEEVNRLVASAGGFTDSISQAFDGLEFNNVEVWIGKSDRMVNRVSAVIYEKPTSAGIPASGSLNFLINLKNYGNPTPILAPSEPKDIKVFIEDIMQTSMADAQLKSRDARRLADIRQLMTGLELYYNDYGRYPKKLTDMKTYIAVVPTAPTPVDGNCTSDQNSYVYTQKSATNFMLTFCLGKDTGSFKAGVHTASPAGIQ